MTRNLAPFVLKHKSLKRFTFLHNKLILVNSFPNECWFASLKRYRQSINLSTPARFEFTIHQSSFAERCSVLSCVYPFRLLHSFTPPLSNWFLSRLITHFQNRFPVNVSPFRFCSNVPFSISNFLPFSSVREKSTHFVKNLFTFERKVLIDFSIFDFHSNVHFSIFNFKLPSSFSLPSFIYPRIS